MSNDDSKIISRSSADRGWGAACPDAWCSQRHEAMANALDIAGITGRHITDMIPTCDTYEFFFTFDRRKFLGKIGLLSDGKVIIIFSSHIPRKGDKLI